MGKTKPYDTISYEDYKNAPTGAHWTRILKAIYEYSPNYFWETDQMNRASENHPLIKKLKITTTELAFGIMFLIERKYLEVIKVSEKPFSSNWKITDKGIDLVIDLLKFKDNLRTNFSIIYLTVMLFLTGVFTFIFELYPDFRNFIFWGYLISVILIGIFLTSVFEKRTR